MHACLTEYRSRAIRAMSTRATMTTTAFESRMSKYGSSSLTNGNGSLVETRKAAPARIWTKIRVTEWTFSLSLFAFSLAVVLGKLYVKYGKFLSWQMSMATFTQMYKTIPSIVDLPDFNMKRMDSESAADVLITFYGKYGWLLKATMSGLVLTSFTWFILYKDSSIPGINPPSPFSSSRQRVRGNSRIQMNYLVGVLNGILCFVYMCL